jgi:MFS family permease
LWLRTNLPETLHMPETAAAMPGLTQSRIRQAYSHRRVMALGIVVLACSTVANYTFSYLVTYAQATLHMQARAGFIASIVGYLVAIPATLTGGWLSDRYGRRPVNLLGNFVFLLMIYPVFTWITSTRTELALIVGTAVLNVPCNIMWGSFFAALAESLPKSIRGSGFGMVYSFSIAAFGGTTQLVITWLIHRTGSPLAPAWYLTGMTVLGQIALVLMAESAPRRAPTRLATVVS